MNMINYDCYFRFHNIGQGLFYTGQIGHICFIYDCGSRNKKFIEQAIKSFCIENSYFLIRKPAFLPTLRILVISHLHSDHVSGLDVLLRKMNVDLVILPYVSAAERVTLWLNSYRPARWYIDFLCDPVSFLLNRGAKKIMILTRGGSDLSEPLRYSEFYDLDIELYKLPEEKVEKVFLEEDEITRGKWYANINEGKLIVATDRSEIKIKGLQKSASDIWKFLFYVKEIDKDKLKRFKSCISSISDGDIKNTLMKKEKRSVLKACYEKVFYKKINSTSLVLYHGPLRKCRWSFLELNFPINKHFCLPPLSFDITTCISCMGILFDDYNINKSVKSQLLCGDADFKKGYSAFMQHFQTKNLKRVAICLLPHHGSEQNWNPSLKKDLSNCAFWVASAALNNKYGHPSRNVKLDIEKSGKVFYWVNEYNYIAFGLKFL